MTVNMHVLHLTLTACAAWHAAHHSSWLRTLQVGKMRSRPDSS